MEMAAHLCITPDVSGEPIGALLDRSHEKLSTAGYMHINMLYSTDLFIYSLPANDSAVL